MALSVGDIYRGHIRFIMAQQICMNVFHFRCQSNQTSPTGVATVLNAGLDKLQAIANQLGNIVHESVHIDQCALTGIHAAAGLHQRLRDLNIDGAATGELLPGFTGVPIYIHTQYAGRTRRGRMHVGGLTEGDQDAGLLSSAGDTKVETLRSIVQTNLTTTGQMQGIIYSRKIAVVQQLGPNDWPNQTEGDPATPWAYVSHTSYSPVLGTVYSRKIGRGQ